MNWRHCLSVAILLTSVGNILADPPSSPLHRWWARVCPSTGCCPDDYVRKPMPSVCVPLCGGVDDYCRKPFPCLTPVGRCGSVDDYCHKSLPCLLCPPLTPYLQCHPYEDRCTSCGHRR